MQIPSSMSIIKNVSLITTVFNEILSIENFLRSYLWQTKFADEFIVLDGGSNDGTFEACYTFAAKYKYLNIILLRDESCNRKNSISPIARGRNKAISVARNKIIAVTDAGCKLDMHWLDEITKPILNQGSDISYGFSKINISNNFSYDYSAAIMPTLSEINSKTYLPSSRCLAFLRSAWSEVDGYPEIAYAAEDSLFAINLRKKNLNFTFAKNAFVFWDCPASYKEMVRKQFTYAKSDAQSKIKRVAFLRNFIGMIIPIWIVKKRLNMAQVMLRYSLLIANQIGYLYGCIQ